MSLSPDSFDLPSIGWDAQRAAEFTDDAARGLIPGRVSRVDRGRCSVLTPIGPLRAATTALPRADAETAVVTGDWVALRLDGTAEVESVLPRRGAIYRASADRTSRRQPLVANVDTVVVAAALTGRLRPSKVERLMALAWDAGATPLVVLTKSDLFDGDPRAAADELAGSMPGAEVIVISSLTGAGLDGIRSRLRGTTVVLGASGVGKSTLVNVLVGDERMDTGDVRTADDKGRHTTVTRELIPIPGGGVLIDTPGLRGIGLQDADDGIEKVYADIDELAASCRFADCGHRSEPGCAVRAAIDDGELGADRLARYERLLRESRWAASRGDAREECRRRDEWKAITKQQRADYRLRERNGNRRGRG
ncbi:putative ribosome biogenesis GTPase RsgA [Gordonia araii NBRC 100433]|uniref:Small ribosomal subunit biogenesis GTPase RsgA n=1 Tax=Gordonia araii NBRC 100433 TaxID=1073574 RepID=G7H6S9_9ACTN|nr:ribosome small subunit-dependent GTPase A [Gordonia araii]NNG95972.1 ribosome small subunit-dependent GTPase A [Gordonia araii NBRC 100433]GAB11554.1 putative ribosome biogenesis GTPase RsgA [Gordonia araii NBRC 100433]